MNAKQVRTLVAALTLGFSATGFAQTFSQQAVVADRAHDGERADEVRNRAQERRDVLRMLRNEDRYAREPHQRARDERGYWQRPAQERRYEPRYEDRRYDGGRRDMRYDRGAGPAHNWYRGSRLPPEYRSRQYVVEDWRGHHLSAPPRGYQWVQAGGDYVLVAIATGIIAQLLLNQ